MTSELVCVTSRLRLPTNPPSLDDVTEGSKEQVKVSERVEIGVMVGGVAVNVIWEPGSEKIVIY